MGRALVTVIQDAVLGVVQGLTEFLPISSTAHLRIVPAFLGWEDPGAAFTAVTQLGTMLAVLLFFRAELSTLTTAWLRTIAGRRRPRNQDERLAWYIVIGTVPIGVAGLALNHTIENGARNLALIGTALIALGLVLLLAERVGARARGIASITFRDAMVVGVAQAAALIPGVSRSGATITGGLFIGLDRAAAARFSFLLSVPAVVLSGLFELGKVSSGEGHHSAAGLALATVLAFIVGYAAIGLLLRFLTSHSTRVYVAYRVALGLVVLALLAAGAIS
jgi:undecaprenyl-diphosphatase